MAEFEPAISCLLARFVTTKQFCLLFLQRKTAMVVIGRVSSVSHTQDWGNSPGTKRWSTLVIKPGPSYKGGSDIDHWPHTHNPPPLPCRNRTQTNSYHLQTTICCNHKHRKCACSSIGVPVRSSILFKNTIKIKAHNNEVLYKSLQYLY